MRNLLNPKWIFLINTFPIAVLLFLFYGEFQIIKSLLEPESLKLWKSFGWTLILLGILNLIYGIYLTLKKQSVSMYYGVIALMCFIPFIYLYGFYSEKIIPFSIPQWMIPGNMVLYVGTFLMPTLAYSLFVLVASFTRENKDHKAWKSFVIAIIIPIIWYVFTQIILPLWKPTERDYKIHVLLIFIIIGTLIFLFFLVRGIFILVSQKADLWQRYQLAWKIPISIILPLLGLLVNNGHLWNGLSIDADSGIFGDFNNFWFYILAFVNGLFICLPNLENKAYRLLLFVGRSITFAYTFYFFIVFLPFLPLSIVAIVAVGTGFLMLTPLLLLVIHIHELSKDMRFLKEYFSQNLVMLLAISGFLTIPICITAINLNNRFTLNQTLDYLYNPDYSKTYNIDQGALKKTLDVVRHHKDKNRDIIFGSQLPYLSTYFNWLVLDNLTLSDKKINTIERIFFGEASFGMESADFKKNKVEITKISSSSSFDKSQNAWKSWIDLEITNKEESSWNAEYATIFQLPEGTWISDYYLYVGNRKEMGILAEKRSALWVFANIRNENRDPGILYYLTGKKVAFKVFPFVRNELRKTGFELLHKEPIQFNIDGHSLNLGDSLIMTEKIVENEHVVYISAKQKESLKKVTRKPYFHIVLDVSSPKSLSNLTNSIEKLAKQQSVLMANAKISFVDAYVSTTNFEKDWKEKSKTSKAGGGFYADRAIKSILFNAYQTQKNLYPVIVIVSDSFNNAVFEKDFSDWSFSFPESDLFYHLTKDGKLEPHSLLSNPMEVVSDSFDLNNTHLVWEYKLKNNAVCYLADNKQASILLKSEQFETKEEEISEKNWNSALTMQAQWTSQILHPETSDKEWLSLVRNSFLTKAMSPVTSYLVVENEAQKAILKKKQEQVLASNKSLDLDEDAQRMSEPGLIILTILLGFMIWLRRKKKMTDLKLF